MKTIVIAAAAASLLAAPAFAQTTSQAVAITGNVGKLCGLGNQSGGGTGGYTPTMDLEDIVDGNGQLANVSKVIGFGNVWCNSAANLSLSATDFTTNASTTDTDSFTRKLDLIVDGETGNGGSIFTYFGDTTSARTGTPATNRIGQAFETGIGKYSEARVRVALPQGTVGNDRPLAGAYAGSVTLTVTPN